MQAILICGPTASGKSALALRLAQRLGGVIINADSVQVYAELRLLTARPDPAEEKLAPHRLYGHVPAARRYSVGAWLEDVAAVLAAEAGAVPIIVGGTGLYFRALTAGMAPVPPIPADIRRAWDERARHLSAPALHAMLAAKAADEAARLRPSDRSRILRALEVLDATGRPLRAWQAEAPAPALVSTPQRYILEPPRGELYRRIDARFLAMLEGGALEEAAAFARLGIDPALPAAKALGLRPLLDFLAGRSGRDAAIAAAQAETRRYAKRQLTWQRHQMADWQRLAADIAVAESIILQQRG